MPDSVQLKNTKMKENENENDDNYIVVINNEKQYSIWFAYKNIPLGWLSAGFSGSKSECLAYIEIHWTDIRPSSLLNIINSQKGT